MPGKPAARIGDLHLHPPVPAPCGPIVGPIPPTPPTVIIGGQPAAVMGDMCACALTAPFPAPIAMGSPTVLIYGRPAARVGDPVASGGVIAPPGCLTVLIGEAGGGGAGGAGAFATPTPQSDSPSAIPAPAEQVSNSTSDASTGSTPAPASKTAAEAAAGAGAAVSSAPTSPGNTASAADAIQAIGPLKGKSKAEIEAKLTEQGFSKAPGKGGSSVWTKPCADGTTAAVRIDPVKKRKKPKNFADEKPHVHKEAVPTKHVSKGNYHPENASKLDDAGHPSTDPEATHIPGGH